ncbi:MAG: BrnT family toxin [Proteobacteria bacterium]|nr:BrnT family toxin [Pseudomonadota bacterium]MBU1965159.1 BrnT family toxin [Pseudomonadota bacterium]MBU4372580.1 BrnT family toxin [Pseudomonadota bacterium]MBU4581073.1 BrnT family toxin [Pseudomonadota bacterium]MCG2740934.1 BrnT family toxin [Syntrophaceae bacterium]
MHIFRWDNEKNELLKKNRGVCFEEVVLLMERGDVLDTIEHPNQERYPGQKIAVVIIDAYAYLVPYVENNEGIFLKTIIPSRKATDKYVRV